MSERQCPRCSVALRHVADGQLEIDTCADCGGLWLDADEWKPIVGSVRSVQRPPGIALDYQRPTCPACGPDADPEVSGLVPRGLRGGGELEIDICQGCGGAWLDRGELDHARAAARLLAEERRALAKQHHERQAEARRPTASEAEQGWLDSLVEAWDRMIGKR